jgi:hypothetical protein
VHHNVSTLKGRANKFLGAFPQDIPKRNQTL